MTKRLILKLYVFQVHLKIFISWDRRIALRSFLASGVRIDHVISSHSVNALLQRFVHWAIAGSIAKELRDKNNLSSTSSGKETLTAFGGEARREEVPACDGYRQEEGSREGPIYDLPGSSFEIPLLVFNYRFPGLSGTDENTPSFWFGAPTVVL